LFLQAEEETARGEFIAADGAKARDEEGREQEIVEET
jgi:hypothetical protein